MPGARRPEVHVRRVDPDRLHIAGLATGIDGLHGSAVARDPSDGGDSAAGVPIVDVCRVHGDRDGVLAAGEHRVGAILHAVDGAVRS